jgi:small-conductance mechanosensitive channel
VSDNRHARRIHTQVVMLRRITIAVVAVIAIAVMLMTFPQARAIGTSLLASAGLAGVVAALAAQSVLGNVFAGLQIAFSDSLRLDDVVIVENEWGRIEEITLSYVVVQVWDDRRIILPTSYFTTKPFQNWTRTEAKLLGTVEIDCDWTMPVEEVREELRRFLEATDLWDGRVSVLQVTEATGPTIRLRALVSASDAPTLWDLRCLVREHLVAWVRDRHGDALPKTRAEIGARVDLPTVETRRPVSAAEGDDRVFSGSTDGEQRSNAFVGPEQPPSEQPAPTRTEEPTRVGPFG